MIYIVKKCAAAAAVVFLTAGAGTGEETLDSIKLPPVKEMVIGKGARLYSVNEEVPKVTLVAAFNSGTMYENENNAGLFECVAKTLSLGGTTVNPGIQFHEKMDSIGAKFSISASWEQTVITIQVLEKYREFAWKTMSDILFKPNFSEEHFKTARSLLIEKTKRDRDRSDVLAFQKIRELIYGGEGYGTVVTEKSLGSITLDQCREAWSRYVNASNVVFALSSSLSDDEIRSLSGKYFSRLARGKKYEYEGRVARARENVKRMNGIVHLIPKKVPQSTIVMGTAAPHFTFKGAYALKVMNYILGGGSFNSRLMREIRVKRGLAYAVQSIMRFRHQAGLFLSYVQTDTASTGKVISLMKKEILKMEKEPVGEQEISWARDAINNSFIFNFETAGDVLSQHLKKVLYGLPGDYYGNYRKKIGAVTPSDIKSESRDLFYDGLVIVVAGDRSLEKKLGKKWKVIVVEDGK